MKVRYKLNGRDVTDAEFTAGGDVAAALEAGETLPGMAMSGWPIVSDALAVHHDQVPEAIADAAKKGVPTEFRKDGRPVLRDRAHRRAYLKAYGFVDRSSFTGY